MAATDTIRQMLRAFDGSTMLMKIIWVNIGVFILLRLAAIGCMFGGNPDFINTILVFIQLPSDPGLLLTRPWTLLTYMFAQYDVLHILFNLLWLYWFGTLFMMVATPRQLLGLYLLGGLGGAVLFLIGYATLPVFAYHSAMLIGSSAAVIAIVTATAILMPDFRMHLLFIGSISLKWIAIATIVLVLIGVTGSNAGGEIAHIGGVAVGLLYGMRMKRGHDITRPFSRAFDSLTNLFKGNFSRSNRSSQTHRTGRTGQPRQTNRPTTAPNCPPDDREALDAILDKIKKSGYSALTPQERQRLFDVSRKIK